MSDAISFQLSKLENDYYGGVGTEKLIARIERLAKELAELDPDDPLRRIFEQSALELWGQPVGSPISSRAVNEAMLSEDAVVHVRAWVSFWKVFAAQQNLRRTG